MTSRTIKNLKSIVFNNSVLKRKNGNEIKILRLNNNVLKIHGKIISWRDLQDLLTNGNFKLITENGKEYTFSSKGGVRPGAGAKKKEKSEKMRVQSFSLSPGAITYLDYLVIHEKTSKSKIIEKLIRKHADDNGLPIA